MKFTKYVICIVLMILLSQVDVLHAAAIEQGDASRIMDVSQWHDVGNIWLRVSNFGFFGSGNYKPQWPSLEYPGGSGIDYLYLGSLWFGAKKVRRDIQGRKLYWSNWPPSDENDTIAEGDPNFDPIVHTQVVIDTLVAVGFDGDYDYSELLPAYFPFEQDLLGPEYGEYNPYDRIVSQSIRTQRAGVDDDGDGLIDEDPIGIAFPFRQADELPDEIAALGSLYLHEHDPAFQSQIIQNNLDIWFPLGFVDLGRDPSHGKYNYTMPYNDDGDDNEDEDGAPVSEQDYISYYYDYSPFSALGDPRHQERKSGSSAGQFVRYPLNIKVRQLSYQWSYEYIKNLVYVEFNITNMNPADTLYDCAMAIYMDCDVGPQAWDGDARSLDDVSGYVAGTGFEFAYTRDYDGDGGLTPGWIGARVCTPDPEQLEFACWVWTRGDGPNDRRPRRIPPLAGLVTSNEKYWLMTGRNPNEDYFRPLRPVGWTPDQNPWYEEPSPNDTRFLFAFYGDMQGTTNPTAGSWNLAPGKTMKIVVAVFPGENLDELKQTATWAKLIYGDAQDLESVILPDIFPHYIAPEPPNIPKMYAELANNGNRIDVYWDNRSEFTRDRMVVPSEQLGWQTFNPKWEDSYLYNYPNGIPIDEWPKEFRPPDPDDTDALNPNAVVNPWTANRLRHDFQGYSLYGRSGSGIQENWMLIDRWDKVETDQDLDDYVIAINPAAELNYDYGGYTGLDKGLPNPRIATEDDTQYYYLDEMYLLSSIEEGQTIYGYHLYDFTEYTYDDLIDIGNMNLTFEQEALIFMNPHDPQLTPSIYLELYDDSLIPLVGHGGQWVLNFYDINDPRPQPVQRDEKIYEMHKDRLARRFYRHYIDFPPKGIEYYVAVSAWDRGMPDFNLEPLESGRDADANMKVLFPGPEAQESMDNIYVVPNPYFGLSRFDGRREGDMKGDRSKRIWFVNLPERATIKIYTLAGDLVDTIEHYGAIEEDIINVSRAATHGLAASGMASWNVLSRHNQILAPGVYLYSVKNHANGKIKVDKFVIIQ
ncbi:MAG: hypothetical protein K0B81_02695 [Candidatus Cloacimonetes bacterium]|nr:hypothetical protein [Candidatus Cloacimonadota bacterium]